MADDLQAAAEMRVAVGKGILAADETVPTLTRRFDTLGIQSTEQTRRSYREMLFAAEGLAEFISGVILQGETIRQTASNGAPSTEFLAAPGYHGRDQGRHRCQGTGRVRGRIRHRGARRAEGSARRISQHGRPLRGVAGGHPRLRYLPQPSLRQRQCACAWTIRGALPGAGTCADRRTGGADDRGPQRPALRGGHRHGSPGRVPGLGRAGCVPGVHAAQAWHGHCGQRVRPSIIDAGCGDRHAALLAAARSAVPGIVFLSGGQEDRAATVHLDAINRQPGAKPWKISFSYGRALQDPALQAWHGRKENLEAGKRALCHRARCNNAASLGAYTEAMEAGLAGSVVLAHRRDWHDD